MKDIFENNIEVAPVEVVYQAARNFAAALAETTQFQAFEQAANNLNHDEVAQKAIHAFQDQQTAWQALIMLNALTTEQKAHLEKLQDEFMKQASVQNYLKAQTGLATLCQSLGDQISEAIGLNYSSACGVSCCG
ncbi:MAG: YlbF family regulator [Anaerolineales bacterium]